MILAAQDITLTGRLHGVTLALRCGEVTAICGPNGAGKSSLIACLAGLLTPETGRITLDDAPLASLTAQTRAQRIGYLPQSGEIAWDVSVETLVALGRLPWPGDGAPAIAAALSAMDLADLRSRPVSRLSGGERARVLLARVLAGAPQWLLVDEPLAMLDLAHAQALLARLRAEAQAGRGVAVVMHDLAAAMNRADRVVVLDKGRVLADGPPEQALAEAVLAEVWGVKARWVGAKGELALAVSALVVSPSA
ncbi:MAG: ATP-binding cassette domain-containing protein [Novosphingobium sp.]